MSAHEQVRQAAKEVRAALLQLRAARVNLLAVTGGAEASPVDVVDATFVLRRVEIDLETQANALFAGANKMRAAAERAR